jgi:hypothetical protein
MGAGGKSFVTLQRFARAEAPLAGKERRRRTSRSPAPNINNEGFAVAPQAECASGLRPVFWSDDANTGGTAIRQTFTARTYLRHVCPLTSHRHFEESSGIIDVSSILGEGWYLLDVQAHYPIAGELVEGGQLLAMYVPPGKKFK